MSSATMPWRCPHCLDTIDIPNFLAEDVTLIEATEVLGLHQAVCEPFIERISARLFGEVEAELRRVAS